MAKNLKICVAMSGGVDSSVAAALMVKKYGKKNVFGVTMRLFCYGEALMSKRSCCSLEAINDAKAVCKKLGIKHYVLDFEKEFEKSVVENFIKEYISGRTPNPCAHCNQFIKFDYLLEKAKKLGADFLATGHYARRIAPTQIDADKDAYRRGYKLLKGVDKQKDQSYFLYTVTQEQLKHLLFPLGDYKKERVRGVAKKLGLKTAKKVESQEICFIPNNNYPAFLQKRLGKIEIKEGSVLDKERNKLGTHLGLPFYTIGQRKGLGISAKKPLYVIRIDVKNNVLIVGSDQDLYSNELKSRDVIWISGKRPKLPLKCKAQVRYNMLEQTAVVRRRTSDISYQVVFDKPVRAITPGQSIVFYKDNEVLGGGIIE